MSWLLIVVLVALVFAIGYGLYTTQGSGISRHPRGDQKPADHPDPEEPEVEAPGVDRSESPELDQRGVDGS